MARGNRRRKSASRASSSAASGSGPGITDTVVAIVAMPQAYTRDNHKEEQRNGDLASTRNASVSPFLPVNFPARTPSVRGRGRGRRWRQPARLQLRLAGVVDRLGQ